MKLLLLLPVVLILSGFTYSQDANDILLAEKYYTSRDFDKAQVHIDLAVQYKKTVKQAKTWYLRGKIYYSIATLSETPSSSGEKVAYNNTSTQAFLKAKELDKKGVFSESMDRTLRMMNTIYLNEGLINFNAKDYSNATFYFELCQKTAEAVGNVDTLAIYNSALSCEKLKNVEEALKNYQKCIDFNYGGPAIYEFKYILLSDIGRVEEAINILSLGLTKYPNDVSLIRSQLKEFTQNDEEQKALDLIDRSIANNPKSAMLYLMRGNLREKLNNNIDLVPLDYKKAIELREDYFDGNQKLGMFYYNHGINDLENSCAILNADEANVLDDLAKDQLQNAIAYLEKARSLKSYDRATLEALKNIYFHLKMTKQYDQIVLQLKH